MSSRVMMPAIVVGVSHLTAIMTVSTAIMTYFAAIISPSTAIMTSFATTGTSSPALVMQGRHFMPPAAQILWAHC